MITLADCINRLGEIDPCVAARRRAVSPSSTSSRKDSLAGNADFAGVNRLIFLSCHTHFVLMFFYRVVWINCHDYYIVKSTFFAIS